MAMAAGIISAVAGLAGSFVQASAMAQQASAQEDIAAWNAARQQEQANREQAAGQAEAARSLLEGERLSARARAGHAQAGVSTSDGTPVLNWAEIDANAFHEASHHSAAGAHALATGTNNAKATLYEGKVAANASRAQATASLIGGIGSAFGAFG